MSIQKIIREYFKIEYIILFLFSFELFDKHHFVLFALFVVLFAKGLINWKSLNQSNFGIVVLWGLAYWIFGNKYLYSSIWIPILFLAFIVGYSMAIDKETSIKVLLIMAVGYALEGIFTVYFAEGTIAAIDEDSRFVKSLWGEGTRAISALNVSMYLFSALIVYLLQKKDLSTVWKIVAGIFECGFVYITVMIAMRSSSIFNPLIILFSLWAYNNFKLKIKPILVVLLSLIVIYVILSINLFGIERFIDDSYFMARLSGQADGGIANNSRFDLHARFWDTYMLDYWGGLRSKVGFYYHNVWMDMYSFSGIISAILFLMLTIKLFTTVIYVCKRADAEEKSILIGVLAAFMLPFYMDPMLWAAPGYFAMFIMCFGMFTRWKDSKRDSISGYSVSVPVNSPSNY